MGFDDRVSSRRRLDRDEALVTAQEVIRRHLAGESVRAIARAVGLPRTSVHRVIVEYRPVQRDAQDDAEAAVTLAKYEAGVAIEDVTQAEQVPSLSDLELYRAAFLPEDHPARAAIAEAWEAGWRWPERPEPTYPTGDGVLDWASRTSW